jgi:hypothetical protein
VDEPYNAKSSGKDDTCWQRWHVVPQNVAGRHRSWRERGSSELWITAVETWDREDFLEQVVYLEVRSSQRMNSKSDILVPFGKFVEWKR